MTTHDRFVVSGGGTADPADEDAGDDDDRNAPGYGSGRGGDVGAPSEGPEERPPDYDQAVSKPVSGGGVADEEDEETAPGQET